MRLLKINDCMECREDEQIAVVRSDVIALFPSLQERNTGKIVAEEMRVSEMKLEGLNYQQIALYVRMNRDLTGDLKNLWRVLPWRRKTGGVEPGMKNSNVNSKKEQAVKTQWVFPDTEPTEIEKRELVARMSEIGVRAIGRNFVYSFGGKNYLQTEGGPIGARITMAASRIVMFDWSQKFRIILEDICLWAPILKGLCR